MSQNLPGSAPITFSYHQRVLRYEYVTHRSGERLGVEEPMPVAERLLLALSLDDVIDLTKARSVVSYIHKVGAMSSKSMEVTVFG